MKLKMLLVVFIVAVLATPAMAAGPYMGASLGVAIFHDSDLSAGGNTANAEYDPGFAFNLNGGYNFDPVRVEAEFGYKNADVDKVTVGGTTFSGSGSDVTVLSYMLNGYYDFKISSPFTPYVGAGLGILHGELDDAGVKSDDTTFGYQFMVGAGYKINKNITLDLSYRFQGATSDFSENGLSISYHSSNILAGLRYNF